MVKEGGKNYTKATVWVHKREWPKKFNKLSKHLCGPTWTTYVEENLPDCESHELDLILATLYRQLLVVRLVLEWIKELAEVCNGFKAIICDVGLQDLPESLNIEGDSVRNKCR